MKLFATWFFPFLCPRLPVATRVSFSSLRRNMWFCHLSTFSLFLLSERWKIEEKRYNSWQWEGDGEWDDKLTSWQEEKVQCYCSSGLRGVGMFQITSGFEQIVREEDERNWWDVKDVFRNASSYRYVFLFLSIQQDWKKERRMTFSRGRGEGGINVLLNRKQIMIPINVREMGGWMMQKLNQKWKRGGFDFKQISLSSFSHAIIIISLSHHERERENQSRTQTDTINYGYIPSRREFGTIRSGLHRVCPIFFPNPVTWKRERRKRSVSFKLAYSRRGERRARIIIPAIWLLNDISQSSLEKTKKERRGSEMNSWWMDVQ